MNELFGDLNMGDLSTIGSLKNFMTSFAVIVISFVGLGIVVSSIFKNSVHGLYASNTKFWDKVYEAKTMKIKERAGDGNRIGSVLKGGTSIILSVFPNVKAYTDFEESDGRGTLTPKAYFFKAIPMMVIVVFIGMFIFFGYPTKTAQKLGTAGLQMFDVVLNNVDPGAWVDMAFKSFANPDFATEDATNDFDRAIYKISKATWNKYVGRLSDMTKERRIAVGASIENWVTSCMSSYVEYTNSKKYTMTVDARIYEQGAPSTVHVHEKTDENGTYSLMFYHEMASWKPGVPLADEVLSNMYIAFVVQFTPKANSEVKETDSLEMKTASVLTGDSKYTINIVAGSDEGKLVVKGAYGKAEVNGKTISINIEYSDDKLTLIGYTGKENLSGVTAITKVSGITYVVDGQSYTVKTIKPDGGQTQNTIFNFEGSPETWNLGEAVIEPTKSE